MAAEISDLDTTLVLRRSPLASDHGKDGRTPEVAIAAVRVATTSSPVMPM
ncbi:MAG: hypothetical protein WBP81_13525 [Solirubrobacteraceae bacterium]